ncbi:hypothetical protein ABE29_18770 [Cytobacillus firmus]|uniref:glycosyltransferase n=1 Tax=Cytobacillus firmus TaxID=1399 RepID=UPI00077CD244|nr:glycosyltransferase [Cytobacillus firmus]MBG9544726.1 hypothetical protein [Cytobacillus firmus]MBG9553995.1 hypothetical protein [Cytobacillus firmus]MBG9558473.1 hypothetical protein [Cytobacillus firmus]MBG9576984.1 hypothetical protein [Cytobacillus firmus]MEC1894365.1 glycosyltransferase [Cytobacillus firmus]
MPVSYYQAISEILKIIEIERPTSILDIGIGYGKYGYLCREILELPYQRYFKEDWVVTIDGIEGFEQYKNPVHEYAYDNVYYGNAKNLIKEVGSYDVVLFIDVLEHFEKHEGIALIEEILAHTNRSLIVSTPIYPSEQGEYIGNELEEHKSRWSLKDFKDFDFTYKEFTIGENGAHIIKFYPPSIEKRVVHSPTIINKPVQKTQNLTITYILPHKHLTGGLKMLLEQMRHLKKRGHVIQAVYRGRNGESVLPTWTELEVDQEILVPIGEKYLNYINDTDVIVAGWMDQIPELKNSIIPVFYWEQGSGYLFGDIPGLQWEEEAIIRLNLKKYYTQDISIVAVSKYVSDVLYARYGISSDILPNYLDIDFYHPAKIPGDDEVPTILLVGNPTWGFKGFKVALHALELLIKTGYSFKVKWVSQVDFELKQLSFQIDVVVSPSQKELADIYRESSILLFASWYEGFGMPPLEAMASGVAVVATNCGGVESYAVNGKNALLFEPGDYKGITTGLLYLLKNKEFRQQMAEEGRKTALEFSLDKGIKLLEQYLYSTIEEFKNNGSESLDFNLET